MCVGTDVNPPWLVVAVEPGDVVGLLVLAVMRVPTELVAAVVLAGLLVG